MNVTVHQRPGVYSAYDASSVVSGSGAGKQVGLVAVNAKAAANEVKIVTSYDGAVNAFGQGTMAELVRLALKNGAGSVAAVPIASGEGYGDGFAALEGLEDVTAVICDSTDGDVQKAMKESVETASANRRERIAVAAGGAEETVDELIARAKALNHERVVLVAPGGVDQSGENTDGLGVAAAVAGAIAGESDPAVPLGGAVLTGLYGLSGRYNDGEMDRLILGGVTPVESLAGTMVVVRGVTTRTTTGEAADATWRDLTTIRIVDDVIPALRASLRARFVRSKNTAQVRAAIRSQVMVELENKRAQEIIDSFGEVSVKASEDDPTVCLVEFSFAVAHGLNRIYLSAHITV